MRIEQFSQLLELSHNLEIAHKLVPLLFQNVQVNVGPKTVNEHRQLVAQYQKVKFLLGQLSSALRLREEDPGLL